MPRGLPGLAAALYCPSRVCGPVSSGKHVYLAWLWLEIGGNYGIDRPQWPSCTRTETEFGMRRFPAQRSNHHTCRIRK